MNKIFNTFWGWLASYVCNNLPVGKLIDILKNYEYINTIDNSNESPEMIVPNEGIFAVKNKTGDIIEIFYENLRFHIVDNGKEDIFQIFLKKKEDNWTIVKRNNVYDISNPNTDSVEVYYWFDIETMHGFRCSNALYNKGYWNQYVAIVVDEFDDFVQDITVERKISNAYKNYKKE